ncbi:MAG: hypothetical protein M1828_001248 [Chrysothrix sp. TS-e1954]|nr:MAG: hypothetical protein M1828_001248 [Chrysothrix sp. TS-e1954]
MSAANELASVLQSASLNRHPDPAYDANPSTAASSKTPVHLDASTSLTEEAEGSTSTGQAAEETRRVHVTSSATEAETGLPSPTQPPPPQQQQHHPHPIPRDHSSDSRIPLSILRPLPRSSSSPQSRPPLPPLPDLRFEQSYLARIKPHADASNHAMVAYVTLLDHVVMPLTQGVVWNLAVFGWRSWNAGVKFRGAGVGARVRRWWWGVNGWTLPEAVG